MKTRKSGSISRNNETYEQSSTQLVRSWLFLGLAAFFAHVSTPAFAQDPTVQVDTSSYNDTSPPLSDAPVATDQLDLPPGPLLVPNSHIDADDPVVQSTPIPLVPIPTPVPSVISPGFFIPTIPKTMLNIAGINFASSYCSCYPPDPNGAAGKTQYIQIVNKAFKVFDKVTGRAVLGPNGISAVWHGFGGVCETHGLGDPVVLYDHLANRWMITQFAGGTTVPTDECIAVSTTSDATGAYYRYAFHLGSNFFDYPKLSVWPDAYYMSMNVFNSAGTSYLGPQAFAFNRSKMLVGAPASFISFGPLGSGMAPLLPADLDGLRLPPSGAPDPFVEFPGGTTPKYNIYRFHVDFTTPANSKFVAGTNPPPAAPFRQLTASIPQPPIELNTDPPRYTYYTLESLGDRLMFRLAYRNLSSHDSIVGNYSVCAAVNSQGNCTRSGVRWFELRNVTCAPSCGSVVLAQESTYAPADGIWRWMGSVATDSRGDLAVGFSGSGPNDYPDVRYAGRLVTDPINTLSQGEGLMGGGGGTYGTYRWGDYSSLSVDPVDDSTFWYTNEFADYDKSQWDTVIGSFKFP